MFFFFQMAYLSQIQGARTCWHTYLIPDGCLNPHHREQKAKSGQVATQTENK